MNRRHLKKTTLETKSLLVNWEQHFFFHMSLNRLWVGQVSYRVMQSWPHWDNEIWDKEKVLDTMRTMMGSKKTVVFRNLFLEVVWGRLNHVFQEMIAVLFLKRGLLGLEVLFSHQHCNCKMLLSGVSFTQAWTFYSIVRNNRKCIHFLISFYQSFTNHAWMHSQPINDWSQLKKNLDMWNLLNSHDGCFPCNTWLQGKQPNCLIAQKGISVFCIITSLPQFIFAFLAYRDLSLAVKFIFLFHHNKACYHYK